MAAITIRSDFGAQKNEVSHCHGGLDVSGVRDVLKRESTKGL